MSPNDELQRDMARAAIIDLEDRIAKATAKRNQLNAELSEMQAALRRHQSNLRKLAKTAS